MQTFLSDTRIYNINKIHFSITEIKITVQNKIEIKTTTTTVIKNELQYSPMSEGNTCTLEPNP